MPDPRFSLPALIEVPGAARWLGLAGLLPQGLAVAALAVGGNEWRFAALALAFAYAALILSFLGGSWWGFATRDPKPPAGLYVLAVVPSLVALAACVPWAIGAAWPGPSLVALGIAILLSPLGDAVYHQRRLTPAWWMAMRFALSIGLGVLTLIASSYPVDIG